MPQTEDMFVFRRYPLDKTTDTLEFAEYHQAAVDKLQTLYPGKQMTIYDRLTIGIETDSLYSDTGIDTYDLGFVDDEIPAMQCQRDGTVLTFRV